MLMMNRKWCRRNQS